MSKGMIYNSRLMPTEVSKWFEMCEVVGVKMTATTRKAIEAFALLEDVLFYVTTVDATTVGGAVLFRDRKRLGMAIATVELSSDYRDRLIRSLIKSSLPFFRTAAIRDVDALVPAKGGSFSASVPPFPYSFILPTWIRPTLEELDFSPVEKFVYGIVQSPYAAHEENVDWDATIDQDAVHKLVWNQRHMTGFDSSHIWLSLTVGSINNSIKTVSKGDQAVLVIGYSVWDKSLLVGPLVWESDQIDDSVVAAAIVKLARELDTTTIHLYLREKKRYLLDLLSTSSLVQEIDLYRKLL